MHTAAYFHGSVLNMAYFIDQTSELKINRFHIYF